ncbi:MAG: hypothetical protein ACOYOB_17985 [Myxococcota bacterium]
MVGVPHGVVKANSRKASLRLETVNRVLGVFGKRLGVVDAPRSELPEVDR